MKKLAFTNDLSRTFHNVGFKIKKHSPEILIVAGVVGTVTSAVMACKATLKVNDILEDSKKTIDMIHKGTEEGHIEGHEYTKEDGKKDLTIAYVQTGVKLAKIYAPSVALGALSIFAMVKSNDILRKRNVALAAAYTAIDKGFKDYRGRVIERFGKDLDRELRYNIKAKEIEERVVDEDGNEKIVKTTVDTIDEGPSDYARFFDEYCTGWTKDPEYNLMFLKTQQAYANDVLRTKGRVFLNEVYAMLGMEQTKAGQIVGWVYDKNNPETDDYIDFGIYKQWIGREDLNEQRRLFVNGKERSILLDFNVDGNVWEHMK